MLKKCKKPDDVLVINAAGHFGKGKRQNQLTEEHIAKVVFIYQFRKEEPRYSRRAQISEIETNDFNLNISRDISTAVGKTGPRAWARWFLPTPGIRVTHVPHFESAAD